MRTNGEIAHDAQMVATIRRCADALDAIAGTLAAIGDMLKPPVFITPKAAIDAAFTNPKMNAAQQEAPGNE